MDMEEEKVLGGWNEADWVAFLIRFSVYFHHRLASFLDMQVEPTGLSGWRLS